jgi:hypothetical protein
MSVAEAFAMTSTQLTTLTSNALATVTGGADQPSAAAGHFPGCGDLDFACQAAKVAQWRDRRWRKMVGQRK